MSSNDRNVIISKQTGWIAGSSSEWYDLFKPMDARCNESNTITKAPLESGIKHFDSKVYDPTEIEIVGYVSIEDVDEFLSLAHAALDEMNFNESLYMVSTKGSTYEDLVMVGLKENDKKDMFDQIEYTISFAMALIEDISFSKNNEGNSDTKDVGLMGSQSKPLTISWYENGKYFQRTLGE